MKYACMRLAPALVFVTLCAGCGKASNDASQNDVPPPQKRLVGTWAMECEVDDAMLKEQIVERARNSRNSQALSETELEQAFDQMKTMIKNMTMTLTLNADGTMTGTTTRKFDISRFDKTRPKGTMVTEKESGEGSWNAATDDDGKITLTLTQTPKSPNRKQPTGKEASGKPRTTRFTIKFEDDSTFVVSETTHEKVPGTVRFRKQ